MLKRVPNALDRRTLPLFPLSNVVLFPGVRAPLHIFEPRYRQMTAAALAGDRWIGMIAVPPAHVNQMEGNPPLFSIGCAGVIAEAERLKDGRYNIVLLGTDRFRMDRELAPTAGRIHRVAEVELLDDPFEVAERPRAMALRARVVELFLQLARPSAAVRGAELTPEAFEEVDPARLVNTFCQLLDLPSAEKQGLLECHGVCERLERLVSVLEFRSAELALRNADALPTRH
ncbi:MAG TPA: LON peptidase substrate-binding domain-containing protein [Myxococcota bacterium]|nr:LON peptidase substrate-binding domain-containing protein [Myxococcota bacterium]